MTIYEKINAGEYEPKTRYPKRDGVPFRLRKPKPIEQMSEEEQAKALRERDAARAAAEKYDAQLAAYQLEQRECLRKFEADLAEEFGLTDAPHRQFVYGMAWENGHSAGLSDVASHYSDLARFAYQIVESNATTKGTK